MAHLATTKFTYLKLQSSTKFEKEILYIKLAEMALKFTASVIMTLTQVLTQNKISRVILLRINKKIVEQDVINHDP